MEGMTQYKCYWVGVPCYLGIGTMTSALCTLYSKWEPDTFPPMFAKGDRTGPISLSQNITFFFLDHLIFLGREEFFGFIEDYMLWWRTAPLHFNWEFLMEIKGRLREMMLSCCSPMGIYLVMGLADVPLCLSEQGRKEVKRGVIVE